MKKDLRKKVPLMAALVVVAFLFAATIIAAILVNWSFSLLAVGLLVLILYLGEKLFLLFVKKRR